MPTKVVFGQNALANIGGILSKLGNPKALIVTDKGIVNAGILEKVENMLNVSEVNFVAFSDVEPNPKSSTIEKGLILAQQEKVEIVIGVGGGSSIDTAKAIAILLNNKGEILDFEGVDKIENDPVPTIMVPTTAGTGSEVTASTVITDEKTLFKAAIISEKIFPTYAIVDPALTLGCPSSITSSTGIDALTHAIESYLSKQKNGIVSEIALKAIKLINENITKSYYKGDDLESKTNMLEASMLAGMAFSQTRLGNVHAISQSFGGVFNIPHGFANAVLLPYVLEFNYPAAIEEYCEIAKAMDLYDESDSKNVNAYRFVQRIKELNIELNIPNTTKELGVDVEQIEVLIRDSMRSGNILVNPRVTNADDIRRIIEDSYNGTYRMEDK